MRIVIIILVVGGLVALFGNLTSEGNMSETFDNVQTYATAVTFAGEFDEIRTSVDEFLELRAIRDTDEGLELANRLDNKLNNLELVKIYCEKEISTLELAYEYNPYEKLQEICPKLETLSFSKAAQLFRMI